MAEARELVLVFFESRDQREWTPIDRDELPEWLRDERIWDRLIAGEIVRNTLQDAEQRQMKWYAATSVDRLRVKPTQILLPPRLTQRVIVPH